MKTMICIHDRSFELVTGGKKRTFIRRILIILFKGVSFVPNILELKNIHQTYKNEEGVNRPVLMM